MTQYYSRQGGDDEHVGEEINLVEDHQVIDVGQRGARSELQRDQSQQRGDVEADAALGVMRPHEEYERSADHDQHDGHEGLD